MTTVLLLFCFSEDSAACAALEDEDSCNNINGCQWFYEERNNFKIVFFQMFFFSLNMQIEAPWNYFFQNKLRGKCFHPQSVIPLA